MGIYIRSLLSAVVALSVIFVSPNSNADKDTEEDIETAIAVADILFGGGEKQVFEDYLEERVKYRDASRSKKKKSLPPGLKKKLARGGELPPGWKNKVARGEVLDADLYRHSHPLPREILRRLPEQPEGTSLRRVDDRIVRIINATHAVLDVFYLN